MKHDQHDVDRVREDRTVEFLRSHGMFSGRQTAPHVATQLASRRATGWRIPLIAAAAALLFAAISLLSDHKPRSAAGERQTEKSPPKLLIWY